MYEAVLKLNVRTTSESFSQMSLFALRLLDYNTYLSIAPWYEEIQRRKIYRPVELVSTWIHSKLIWHYLHHKTTSFYWKCGHVVNWSSASFPGPHWLPLSTHSSQGPFTPRQNERESENVSLISLWSLSLLLQLSLDVNRSLSLFHINRKW